MRKCGFVDCNNSVVKGGKDCCQNCKERKEWFICSTCKKTGLELNWQLFTYRPRI